MSLTAELLADTKLATDPMCRELLPVLLSPTSRSSAGFPYLQRPAFTRLRDWVPHILANTKHGKRIAWLTLPKILWRMIKQPFAKRDPMTPAGY